MRNLSIIFSAFILFFAFTACQQDEASLETSDGIVVESIAAFDVESEVAIESAYDDVDQLSEAGMDLLGINLLDNGRLDSRLWRSKRRDLAFGCSEIERDTVNKVITVDFGDGCVGPLGVVRKGKIIITYTGSRHEAGAYREVSLEDFYVDSLHIEGTRKYEIVSSDTTTRVVNVTMARGKVTFPDESFATREAAHVRTVVKGEEEGDDYSTLSGEASGTKTDGTVYSITILEDLLFKRGCWEERFVIAVSGVKEIVNGDSTMTIGYGDGTCDNEVTITVNGVTIVKTINPKGRRG